MKGPWFGSIHLGFVLIMCVLSNGVSVVVASINSEGLETSTNQPTLDLKLNSIQSAQYSGNRIKNFCIVVNDISG